MPDDHTPIGTAVELQIALDETIERLRGFTWKLIDLDEEAAWEAVKAWQGQGSLDLAMARLARCLSGKDTYREKGEGSLVP